MKTNPKKKPHISVSPTQMRTEPIPDYGDHMTVEHFGAACDSNSFIDYDGSGYYASHSEMFPEFPAVPSEVTKKTYTPSRHFTHIVWFSK